MRDLDEDLKICEAATQGPYQVTPCPCASDICNQVFISITRTDGRLEPEDAKFIADAREGWPHAIKRAKEAEEQVDKLINEMGMLQDELNRGRRV
jgi:hypothetical protein